LENWLNVNDEKKNLGSSWPWLMSEERKKRETIVIEELITTNERQHQTTQQTSTSLVAEGKISDEPRLGLLILESYGSSVPPVNPDKVLLEYIKFLVS
jgi:hypothetical protein